MIEIITIGDELISGRTADENARFLGEAFYLRGFSVSKITILLLNNAPSALTMSAPGSS